MKNLALKCGDSVGIIQYRNDGSTRRLTMYTLVKPGVKIKGGLILNSPLHLFIENLGFDHKADKKIHTLQIRSSKFFRNIRVVEIERKPKWYTTILRNLIFWRKMDK